MIPYKPYAREKHVESILGTFLTHENKNIQFEYYNLWQCTFSRPHHEKVVYLVLIAK